MVRFLVDTRIPLRHRIGFIFSCVPVLLTRRVYFLGKWFVGDNPLGLLTLPEYIPLVLNVYSKMGKPKTVNLLDIGANVGQFAWTWLSLLGGDCLSVEPNRTVYPYLKSNMRSLAADRKTWKLLESGCGPTRETKDLFFVPNKSAQGSLNVDLARSNLLSRKKIRSIESLFQPIDPKIIRSLGIDSENISIVKIDVEGNEVSAIQGLTSIAFQYALVEVSESRGVGSTFQEIKQNLELATKKNIAHVFSDDPLGDGTIVNALFKIG
jgi:FkbM family methyltransferase